MGVTVAYLDDGDDIRLIFCQLIKHKLGLECLSYASVRELIGHSPEVLRSEIIFLDINLSPGEPSGIDAYDWLRKQKYQGKIFFLTGHGNLHPLVAKAKKCGVQVLEKPIPANQLCELIEQSLALSSFRKAALNEARNSVS